MTASSIFKAFLPKTRATNCTSQAGQDGIHLTALPLISPPSAANQTYHIAAFCLLTVARAKELTLTLPVWTQNTRITGSVCVSLYLFVSGQILSVETGLNHSKWSLSPGSTSGSTLSQGQQCSCVFLPPRPPPPSTLRPAPSSQFAYTTLWLTIV